MISVKLNEEQIKYARDILFKGTPYEKILSEVEPGKTFELERPTARILTDECGTNEGFLVMEIDDTYDYDKRRELERQLRICSQLTDLFAGLKKPLEWI